MSTIISMEDTEAALAKAVEALSAGSVVVLPVGGVYAVVADAFRAPATQRIFAARRRSRATPLPVLIRSERQVAGLAGEVPEAADRLMAAYWPGDLTLILRASDGMTWDLGNSLGTVQLRQPSDDFLLQLIGTIGPLACTAANRLDQPRPVTVEGAKQQLGVLVPVYLDGGERDGSVSTVVDATGPSLVTVREGSIPAHHIDLVGGGELPWGERPQERPDDDAPDAPALEGKAPAGPEAPVPDVLPAPDAPAPDDVAVGDASDVPVGDASDAPVGDASDAPVGDASDVPVGDGPDDRAGAAEQPAPDPDPLAPGRRDGNAPV